MTHPYRVYPTKIRDIYFDLPIHPNLKMSEIQLDNLLYEDIDINWNVFVPGELHCDYSEKYVTPSKPESVETFCKEVDKLLERLTKDEIILIPPDYKITYSCFMYIAAINDAMYQVQRGTDILQVEWAKISQGTYYESVRLHMYRWDGKGNIIFEVSPPENQTLLIPDIFDRFMENVLQRIIDATKN